MTMRDVWPVAWALAFVANVVGVVGGLAAGNWYAAIGWACAALASLSASASGAMLVRLQRESDWVPDYPRRVNPNHPGWDDEWDDGAPRRD